ncbi:MAG: glycosyltransferase family 47 protein [Verrucomicrobiota bacterium]|nr:glycosyltransferase family 47 protein [Verrucomicrobiota bacterium]
MASVYLLSAAPDAERSEANVSALVALQTSADADIFGVHSLTTDPHTADLILFAELWGAGMQFQAVRRHPLVRRYREKCFLFSSTAFPIPFLPGVYASIEARRRSRRTCGGFHVMPMQNEFTSFAPPADDLPYLFSFIGSARNAPVRQQLAHLSHPRGYFCDTAAEFQQALHGRMSPDELRDYARRFVDITKASKFVLCPRGLGAATIRLMEAMRVGRAPVIISDGWVAPVGPDWDGCSIRVREGEIDRIPRLLEEMESKSAAMGNLARQQWELWFSEKAAFHRVVDWCLQIREERILPESLARLPAYLHLLQPFHLRWLFRPRYHALRRFLRPHRPAADVSSARSDS